MKKHFTNAGYGVLDYISYPIGMLLVAPIVVHKLGAAEYGLWMITTALISAGGIVASGFCDASIQRVAYLRGIGNVKLIPDAVRSMLGINIALGTLLATGAWFAAPLAARHVAVPQLTSNAECVTAFRISSLAILVRAIESVAVGAQRAFEQYRGTVQISTAMRILTLASAAALAIFGKGTISILLATCGFLVLATAAQFFRLRKVLSGASIWPGFHATETRILFRQGFFVWLQALGGVVFGQLDRILLGLSLGAVAVTPYALCVQFAHPIYGLSASGFNFLFPYLSTQAGTMSRERLRQAVAKAFGCNMAIVAIGAALLLCFGDRFIRIWAGATVAKSAATILLPIVVGAAFMGLSVTGTYALQALADFRTVAIISLAGRAVMLFVMVEMLHIYGLRGLAFSRLFYGLIALLVYLPLIQRLRISKAAGSRIYAMAVPIETREVLKP